MDTPLAAARAGLVTLLMMMVSFGSTALLLHHPDDDPGRHPRPGTLMSDDGWTVIGQGSLDPYTEWELATARGCDRLLVLPSQAPNRAVAFERSNGIISCDHSGDFRRDSAAHICEFGHPGGDYWFAPPDYDGGPCPLTRRS